MLISHHKDGVSFLINNKKYNSSTARLNRVFSSYWRRFFVLVCILLFSYSNGFSQYKNEEELKKQAEKHFEDEEYGLAYKEYSQLVANYPKDVNYNYRLGVCMLFAEPDKKKCFSYLEFANKKIDDAEKEARFYLAKAYHFNFQFDEAIKLYAQYKTIASGSMIKKLKVDREIQSCKNGKRLLSNLNELVVLEKKQLPEADYYRSYNLSSIGGKLLVKPVDFMSSNDKKKKNKSIVYLPKSNDQVFYSSYGTGDNKDIYIKKRLPDGTWGLPENIGAPVNTEFDEDYPFLHPNGKILYFASQGHTSMGGYDIFKSEWDEANKKWKTPVNMDFPINTPNDEILFVSDSLEKTAYFSSTRQSAFGKIDVYKINTERHAPEFIYVKGTVLKKSPEQSVNSKFTIKNAKTGENLGNYEADQAGSYLMKLPNGGKFIFTVETPGFTTQSEGVEIPESVTLNPYQQVTAYKEGKLVFENFFDVTKGDENSYLKFLDVIEQKSKMEVNASDFTNQTLATTNSNTSAETNPKTNNANASGNTTTPSNLNNAQLEKIAFDDAKELKEEAIKLKSDANDAFTYADNQKFEASQKNKDALFALDAANKERNPTQKETLQAKANELKEEAQKQEGQAKLADNIAHQLEMDATNKQKEAELQLKYAEQLKEVNSTKNNKEALLKLENIQKELEIVSKEKSNVNELANSIDADIKRKEEEQVRLESIVNKEKNGISELETEAKNLDTEISNTKDKAVKNNLLAQKEELQNELKTKKSNLQANQDKLNFVTSERETLKSQSDFANTMLSQVKENGQISVINPNTTATVSNDVSATTANDNTATDFPTIKNKKEEEIKLLSTEPESVKKYEDQKKLNNELLVVLNKEITVKKTELKTTKNTAEKKSITNQLKELEALKKQKEADTKLYDSKIASQKNSEKTTNGNPVVTSDGNPTNDGNYTSQLNDLTTLNNSTASGKELFNNTNYTNTEAIQLKQQAETDFTSAIKKEDALTNKLNEFKNTENSTKGDYAAKAATLTTEITQLQKEASALRKEGNANQAKEKEAIAATKKYELAILTAKENEAKFELNQKIIDEYKAANGNKTTANTIKANDLISESSTLYKQAIKIEEEANAEQDIAARAAAFSNVEEKEVQSLQKQEEAIALYKKSNPSFKPKSTRTTSNTTTSDKLNELKQEIESKNNEVNNSLLKLAEANQKEYISLLANLANNTASAVNQFKEEAAQLKEKADQEINLSSSETSSSEKNKQLVHANKLYQEAIAKLTEAEKTNTISPGESTTVTSPVETPTSNTVTPNLSPEEIKTIKESEEFQTYTKLANEAEKYDAVATQESAKAKEYYDKATNSLKESNDLRIAADKMPEGTAKKAKQKEAVKKDRLANEYKAKGDSINELATSTRGLADSKKMEAETYGATLDKKVLDKIIAVSGTKPVKNTETSTTVTTTPATTSNTTSLADDALSESFKSESENIESNLKTLSSAPENEDNLKAINELLTQYNSTIDNELADKKKKAAKASATQKVAINKQIKSLEAKKTSNTKAITTNRTKIKKLTSPVVETPVVTTTHAPVNNTSNGSPLKGNGFEIKSYNAYSESNPIPIDEKLPEGIIFAVQIGAFKSRIPNNLFKGLYPLRGETTAQGFIRYQAGRFTKFETANGVKNDLKKLGYKDAFVVVYKNGQIISLGKIFTELKNQGITVSINPNETAGITGTTNIRPASEVNAILGVAPVVENSSVASNELNDIQGMLFTVQIGVYSTNVTSTQLHNLKPLYREQIPSGYYRYTAGIYTNIDKVKTDKQKVNDLGIKDAFVSAYLNGSKIKIADALAKINSGESIQFPAEKPIQFGGATRTPTNAVTPANNTNSASTATIQPFTNGVTQAPKPTSENGVKTGDAGITFKVQIGAYRSIVPPDVASNFLKIKEWPIQSKQLNGLLIYTIGSFVDAKSARPLVEKAKQNGIVDAFITVYKDGVKLYGAEASGYLK